jgi:DNA-binding NarL/FixJ family response regulator
MSRPIRVVLADDHAVVRKGIREFLEAEEDIVVVAEAGDGAQAVALVAEHRPDVAVLDIQMPCVTGIEATDTFSRRPIRRSWSRPYGPCIAGSRPSTPASRAG